eukprot:TRINITY_DN26632_c0_g5_i1.p1 TRINITY_DN26632_c0_g5~~TRINITY_DN26632_c0_g5_i1.p1  ORF type:complete len:344 (-),score=35.99 TRINITY_DN26632_c0_g5_i1:123-1154(-)
MGVFQQNLEAALNSALICADGDVAVLTSDGARIHAHSFVLKTCSPVFNVALAGPMREAQLMTVRMDCSAEVAAHFLRFLYTGCLHVRALDSLHVIGDLVHLSDYYDVIAQFSEAFARDECQDMYKTLITTTLQQAANPCAEGIQILMHLKPLLLQRRSFAGPVFARLRQFSSACHHRELPGLQADFLFIPGDSPVVRALQDLEDSTATKPSCSGHSDDAVVKRRKLLRVSTAQRFVRLLEAVSTMSIGAKNKHELTKWLREIEALPSEREAIARDIIVCKLDMQAALGKAKLVLSLQHHRHRRLLLDALHQGMLDVKQGSEPIEYLEEELLHWLSLAIPELGA